MQFNSINKYRIMGYSYLEIILLLYTFLIDYTTAFIPLITIKKSLYLEVLKFSVLLISTILVLFGIKYILGSTNDFRYKLVYHSLPVMIALISEGTYIGEIIRVNTNKGIDIMVYLPLLSLFTVIPSVLLVLISFMMQFDESTFYINEFNKTAEQYINGDIKTRVNNSVVLNDNIFGKLANQTNIILDKAEENLELKQQNVTMKNVAETLASTSEEVNAAIEEISSTSTQMSRAATEQTDIIYDVNNDIKNTSLIIDEIINNIRANNEQVSTISLQTSILSLNAAIEASRAGDYGRGFAVVAENIRQLSEQTSIASKEISSVTNDVANKLEAAFKTIINKMDNIVAVSEETAASAEEVSASTSDIASSIGELSNIASNFTNID